jgi:predicted nuclease with RNAse H fold
MAKHIALDMDLPDLVVHADWGASSNKRQMAVAEQENGNYVLRSSEAVNDPSVFQKRLEEQATSSCAVVGFDFPIGVPEEYARRAGISSFPGALSKFGKGKWKDFYERAKQPDQISIYRPFYPLYPNREGGVSHQHLTEGLGISDKDKLLRRCERATENRKSGSMLFWTLGGEQVGHAAQEGWKKVLAPLLESDTPVRLWPFDGDMEALLEEKGLVVVETYPAEAYLHLEMNTGGFSKNDHEDRKGRSGAFFRWAAARKAKFAPALHNSISDGFGGGDHGEDRFDATVGLCSMIEVLLGQRPEGAPQDEAIRSVEGWIFGQTDHT